MKVAAAVLLTLGLLGYAYYRYSASALPPGIRDATRDPAALNEAARILEARGLPCSGGPQVIHMPADNALADGRHATFVYCGTDETQLSPDQAYEVRVTPEGGQVSAQPCRKNGRNSCTMQ